jgi:hypothetical protein
LFSSRSKRTQRVLKLNKFKHGKYTNELSWVIEWGNITNGKLRQEILKDFSNLSNK